MMKKTIWIWPLLLSLALCGCQSRTGRAEAPPTPSPKQSAAPAPTAHSEVVLISPEKTPTPKPTEPPNSSFYPMERLRLSGDGRLLQVQNGCMLAFLDEKNQPADTVSLIDPEGEALYGEGTTRLIWNDSRIAALGLGESQVTACVYEAGDEIRMANISFWDMDGKLLKAFPKSEVEQTNADGNLEYLLPVPEGAEVTRCSRIELADFMDDDHFFINAHDKIYVYSLREDTVTLVDDMTGITAGEGKNAVYLGADYSQWGVYGGKAYYLAFKDKALHNTAGTVWVTDGGESRELFDGETVNHFTLRDNLMVACRFGGEGEPDEVFYAYAKDETLKSLGEFDLTIPFSVDDGRISFVGREEGQYIFYCYDAESGKTVKLTPTTQTESGTYTLAGTRLAEGELYFVYTDVAGQKKSFEVNAQSGWIEQLPLAIFPDTRLPAGQSFFYEYEQDPLGEIQGKNGVRVVPFPNAAGE